MGRFVRVSHVCAKDVRVGDIAQFSSEYWHQVTDVQVKDPEKDGTFSVVVIAGHRNQSWCPLGLVPVQLEEVW